MSIKLIHKLQEQIKNGEQGSNLPFAHHSTFVSLENISTPHLIYDGNVYFESDEDMMVAALANSATVAT